MNRSFGGTCLGIDTRLTAKLKSNCETRETRRNTGTRHFYVRSRFPAPRLEIFSIRTPREIGPACLFRLKSFEITADKHLCRRSHKKSHFRIGQRERCLDSRSLELAMRFTTRMWFQWILAFIDRHGNEKRIGQRRSRRFPRCSFNFRWQFPARIRIKCSCRDSLNMALHRRVVALLKSFGHVCSNWIQIDVRRTCQ